MKYKDEQGNWVSIAMPSFDGIPIGTIVEYAGSVLPKGYLFCDGTSISRTDYADLFNKIGTAYGIGDGSTTFNLPNFKGRIGIGLNSTDLDFDTLGETGGSKTNTLSLENYAYKIYNTDSDYANNDIGGTWNPFETQSNLGIGSNYVTNKNTPVNNLQPYVVVNYIIKAKQTTPTSAQIIDEYGTSTTDGYSQNYINNKFIIETVDFGNKTISANDATYVTMPNKTGYTPYCLQPLVSGDWADKYATYVPLTTDNTSGKVGIRNENQSNSYTWNIKVVVLYVKNN